MWRAHPVLKDYGINENGDVSNRKHKDKFLKPILVGKKDNNRQRLYILNEKKILARFVYEAYHGIILPRTVHVHHKDLNIHNYNPNNLEALGLARHWKKHRLSDDIILSILRERLLNNRKLRDIAYIYAVKHHTVCSICEGYSYRDLYNEFRRTWNV